MKSRPIDYSKYGATGNKVDYSQYGYVEPQKEEPEKFDKLKSAQMIMGMITGNPFPLAKSAIEKTVPKIPGQIADAYKTITEGLGGLPKTPFRDIGAGIADIGAGVVNAPLMLPKLMGEVGLIPESVANKIQSFIPQVPTLSHENETAPDKLLRGLINSSPIIYGGVKGVPAAYETTGTMARKGLGTFSSGNPLQKAHIETLNKVIENKNMTLEDVAREHEQQLAAENQAKTLSEEETGKAKPSTMKYAAKQEQKSLGEKGMNLQELNKQLEESKNLPELPEINTKNHEENVSNAENALKESEKQKENLGNLQNESAQTHNNIKTQISEHLNEGAAHDVHVAQGIKNAQEEIHSSLSGGYKNLEQEFSDKHVVIDRSKQLKDMNDKLLNLVREGNIDSPKVQELGKQITDFNKNEIIPATDYLTMLQSAKQYAREARKKAYSPGMNAEERAMWKKQYDELDNQIEEMDKHFENAVGKENNEKLKELNKGWREKVVPMQKNTTYQNILKKGRMSENIMKSLRGTDPGDIIMRNIIKSNPELLRHTVGQQYSEKPTALSSKKGSELRSEYIEQMPELKELVKQREEAKAYQDKLKERVSAQEKRHKELEKSHKEAISNKQLAENEAKNVANEKEKREATSASLQNKINAHKKDISEGNEKIYSLKKHIDILSKEKIKSTTTAKRVADVKKEIDELKRQLKEAKVKVESSKGKIFKLATKGYRMTRGVARALQKI